MRHMGNITVTAENVHDFPAADEFFGHLTVERGANLVAPSLRLIRGWLSLHDGVVATFPQLGEINGWCTLGHGATLNATNLKAVTNDLVLGIDARAVVSLIRVGSIVLQRSAVPCAMVLMDDLGTVEQNLVVGRGRHLVADRLQTVGKSITLQANAVLDAPALAHIGGWYDADPTAVMHAPKFGAA